MPQIAEKEPKLFQAYGVFLFRNNHPTIKELESIYNPSIHGHKTWNSSFLIMDYFLHQHLLKPDQHIMELGSGCGPAGIFCAENAKANVTGVDMDADVFPFMHAQAALNNVSIQQLVKPFEALNNKDFKPFDLVFGADICFWDSFTKTHYALIKKALDSGVKDIVFADPGRSPFYQLADLCQKEFRTEYLEWYSTGPNKFEGYILHIKQ